MTLSDSIERNNNNYDAIRLLAALMVIFGHSFALFDPVHGEPFMRFFKPEYSGSLAVEIFFFLSGIYVSKSFTQSKTMLRFFLMRAFRLWPALLVCVLITVFVVGPLLTQSNAYFFSAQTWQYLGFNTNGVYKVVYNLPGVFMKNHYPISVNGSLWTLPVEVRCYLILFLLGVAGAFKKPILIIGAFLLVLTLFLTKNELLISVMTQVLAVKLLLLFLAGAIVFIYRKYLVLDYRIAAFSILMSIITYRTAFFFPLFYPTLLYTMLWFGATAFIKVFKLPGDYSYGVYIYGWLVQQLVNLQFPELNAYRSMLITVPVAIIAGVLSWHFVEKPALSFARALTKNTESRKAMERSSVILNN